MGKSIFSLSKKITLLLSISLFFSTQFSFSQCTNPDPTGVSPQTFCDSDSPTIADLVATGNLIAWFDVQTGGSQYSNTTPLENGKTYYADDIDGGGCSPNRLAVTVEIYGYPPTNVDVFVGKCASENAIIADLSATGTNIAWYDAQTGGNLLSSSFILVDGQTYWVQQTENGCTSNRLPTTVSLIDPATPNVSVNQSFCSPPNPTVADLQASESNVIWYDSETSTIPLSATEILIDGEDYWVTQTVFPCESTVRAQTIVTIDIAPNAGTNGSYSECEINLATTNLFSLLGGTPDVTGIWSGPSTLSGGYLGTFVPGINTEGIYTYTVSSALGICPDEAATVEVIILEVPPPTTTNPNQSFCEVDNPTVADLSATGTNILWYISETSTTPLNTTDTLIDGQNYWATQTDTTGCESITRLEVTVTITSPLPPTTSETNQSFCEIDNPTVADLNATGTNILWYISETSTTPLNTTDALIDGQNYWATQTDVTGCESATRLMVTVTIISPLPPTTSEANQSFCEIDNPTVADLNATGTTILWYISETSTTPLNTTDTLINGQSYWAAQTDVTGCESATRLQVTVAIFNPLPPTTSDPNQSFCLAYNPTVADLQATGDVILWFDSETSTTPLIETEALVNGEDYWALNTIPSAGCESASRLQVTVTIFDVPPPVIDNLSQTFCGSDNPTILDLNTSQNTVWFDSETSTTPLNLADALIDGQTYWAAQSNVSETCISSIRVSVNVILIDPGTPILATDGNEFCIINNPTLADLNDNVAPLNNGTITWYDFYPGGSVLSLSQFLVDNETYIAIETDADGCSSVTPLEVTVDLNACDDYDIVIYDGFSPTGDGINDTFVIGNLRVLYPDFNVEFYNRWGELMYSYTIQKPDWNGRYNGDNELAPAGVYYFIINFNKEGKKPIQKRLYLSH